MSTPLDHQRLVLHCHAESTFVTTGSESNRFFDVDVAFGFISRCRLLDGRDGRSAAVLNDSEKGYGRAGREIRPLPESRDGSP